MDEERNEESHIRHVKYEDKDTIDRFFRVIRNTERDHRYEEWVQREKCTS